MSQDAVRNIYGIHPASKGYDETVFTTMTVKSGSYLAYEPINLKGIESMTFRYRPEKAATLEVRVDAPDGTVLARIELANTPGSIKADPYDVIQAIIQDNPRRRRGLRAGVYEGWNEITVPIKDPGGRRTLYLVFKGEESENLLQLDWMYFNGDVK
jgi:cytochrome c